MLRLNEGGVGGCRERAFVKEVCGGSNVCIFTAICSFISTVSAGAATTEWGVTDRPCGSSCENNTQHGELPRYVPHIMRMYESIRLRAVLCGLCGLCGLCELRVLRMLRMLRLLRVLRLLCSVCVRCL